MNAHADDLLPPCILVVDDERQIHSSLRLRLGDAYQVVCLFDPREALPLIKRQSFDLCIADVHMPGMDGLEFIEAARELDPALGYVILSGFDSEDNLRRAIPLQVLEFLTKPLPDHAGFEQRMPDWIARTRQRRHELNLARQSETIVQDLELARIERDVESTASESAREALLQTSGLLTTIQALLLSAQHTLDSLEHKEPKLTAVTRGLQEARRNAEAAASVADGFFASAYADRESSPAVIDACLRHGIDISLRRGKAEERHQHVDCVSTGRDIMLAGLTGIDFLLMIVPALLQALELAAPGTTVQVRCHEFSRLGEVTGDPRWRKFLWVNRRNAVSSSPGVALSIRANAPALDADTMGEWLRGNTTSSLQAPSRGLVQGIHKAKGLLGVAIKPNHERFELLLALPI